MGQIWKDSGITLGTHGSHGKAESRAVMIRVAFQKITQAVG